MRRHAGVRPELGQILFGIIEARRPRTTKKPEGLSGIEIGFIRAIGEIVDLATMVPVIVAPGGKRIITGKANMSARRLRTAAALTGALLEIKPKVDRRKAAAISH